MRISSDGDTGREHVRRHYVVLEWAQRGDLAPWTRKERTTLLLADVLQVGLDAAAALTFAHAQGCIHRDVKPHNLLRMADGTLKLTDFDLAKLVNSTLLTRTGTAGTAFYIAPELQESAEGDELMPISEAVDVYSLGWTLIALLKGKDITASDLVKREALLQTLQVPASTRQIMLTAIEVEPTDRYPTMQAFREALVHARTQVSKQQGKPSVPPPRTSSVLLTNTPVLITAQQLEAELARLPLAERLALLNEVGKTGDPRLGLEKPENWIYLPPGEFRMGDHHTVKLTQGFHLSRFPVTNHDFRPFVEGDGYRNRQWWSEEAWEFKEQQKLTEPGWWQDARWNAPNQPVVGVSWFEAQAFCAWLSAQRFSTEVRGPFRLPTEAEWEYAARGKEGRTYPWGNDALTPERANYDKTGLNQTSPVGAFPLGATKDGATGGGLLDLAGNVWEWCEDWYGEYPSNTQIDPSGFETGSSRVLRGGSWLDGASDLRGAFRFWFRPSSGAATWVFASSGPLPVARRCNLPYRLYTLNDTSDRQALKAVSPGDKAPIPCIPAQFDFE